ncbi:hypothetical protein [Mesorhizobium sp. M1D.F.Ca.ET.043.01.1.1]|uniref:hypothetical protein n=1 Tax=unclassified Mesorhizobium TaxID=325217 RepID=UPI0026D39F17
MKKLLLASVIAIASAAAMIGPANAGRLEFGTAREYYSYRPHYYRNHYYFRHYRRCHVEYVRHWRHHPQGLRGNPRLQVLSLTDTASRLLAAFATHR